MKRFFNLLVFTSSISCYVLAAHAQTITYSTFLNDANGQPLQGLHSLTFVLRNEDGTAVSGWSHTEEFLVENGFISTRLSGNVSIPASSSKYTVVISENGITYTQGTANSASQSLNSMSAEFKQGASSTPHTMGALIPLTQLDQSTASNGQVLTWVSGVKGQSPQWAPMNAGSGGGQSGVLSFNSQKGDVQLQGGSGIRIDPPSTVSGVTTYTLSIDTMIAPPAVSNYIPIGTVLAFAGDTSAITAQITAGEITGKWMLCDGRWLTKSAYPVLEQTLKTTNGHIYGDSLAGNIFFLPDYRGMFLRGVNGLRSDSYSDPYDTSRVAQHTNGNTGNTIGTLQSDGVGKHTHYTPIWSAQNGTSSEISGFTINPSNPGSGWSQYYYQTDEGNNSYTSATTGPKSLQSDYTISETRPKNIYVNYIIKVQ